MIGHFGLLSGAGVSHPLARFFMTWYLRARE
jgi:hypothetical protein